MPTAIWKEAMAPEKYGSVAQFDLPRYIWYRVSVLSVR